MQPSHARLYRPGISFRFGRSPEAPKITRTHESPVGSGSCDNFSRGLAWIIADIVFSLWMFSIWISNRTRQLTYSGGSFQPFFEEPSPHNKRGTTRRSRTDAD